MMGLVKRFSFSGETDMAILGIHSSNFTGAFKSLRVPGLGVSRHSREGWVFLTKEGELLIIFLPKKRFRSE